MAASLGMHLRRGGAEFAVRTPATRRRASRCACFDGEGNETRRVPLAAAGGNLWSASVPGWRSAIATGFARTDLRSRERPVVRSRQVADGPLRRRDRPALCLRPRLRARGGGRRHGAADAEGYSDEAAQAVAPPPPLFRPGGLIYELNVRSFTMRHPECRSTSAARSRRWRIRRSSRTEEAAGFGGRADAGHGMDRRAPSRPRG